MGEFLDKVKRGKIPGPRRQDFSLDRWKLAFAASATPDTADAELYDSALAIHGKLTKIRELVEASTVGKLPEEVVLMAFVAASNQQLGVIDKKLGEHRESRRSACESGIENSIAEFSKEKIRLIGGADWSPDEVIQTLVDGIQLPIASAQSLKANCSGGRFEDVVWDEVRLLLNLGVAYKYAEDLWEDCLWNTCRIVGPDDFKLVVPRDIDRKRGYYAALPRTVALGIESAMYAQQAVEEMRRLGQVPVVREVCGVEIGEIGQRFMLAPAGQESNDHTWLLAMKSFACPEYFDELLVQPQPGLSGLSLSRLLDAWTVVSQAAMRLHMQCQSVTHPDEEPLTHAQMRLYASSLKVEILEDVVQRATGVAAVDVRKLIEFLTFRGERQQEIWAQPLVPLGGDQRLPVFAALKAPNLRYLLERWMRQLNIDLEQRGPAFETYLRRHVAENISESPMLAGLSGVVPVDYTFTCGDGSEQIDLLFHIGSLVVLAEAKCILEPSDMTSLGTHRETIERGTEQALRRVRFIDAHRPKFVADTARFGWSLPPDFRIIPLVVISTVAQVGEPVNGVAIVDDYVLARFFVGGYDRVGLSGPGGLNVVERRRHQFYGSAGEAQDKALDYFLAPPQLDEYKSMVKTRYVPILPATDGDWRGLAHDLVLA